MLLNTMQKPITNGLISFVCGFRRGGRLCAENSICISGEKTAAMRYRSDYLGRMERITYPDGEVVTYEYDDGGRIKTVTGERQGRPIVL